MPDLSGYDLLKIIRENKSIKDNNVPFIFLTALGQKADMVKGIGSSANDYLVKPVDFDLLIAKIKEKFTNASKVKEVFNKNIDGLKTQISTIVPMEFLQYVDAIKQVAEFLKTEPYGPFPHKKYSDDINKIYINAVKLRTVINNFLSGEAITDQLDTNDEILNPVNFIGEFVNNLGDKLRTRIKFEGEGQTFPEIKVDKTVVLEAVRRFLTGLFKTDQNSQIDVGLISDHQNQLVFIFHLKGDLKEDLLRKNVDEEAINKVVEKQGCTFQIVVKDSDFSGLLYIPSYRVIRK
jgi:CheY-like chemotaxis protein